MNENPIFDQMCDEYFYKTGQRYENLTASGPVILSPTTPKQRENLRLMERIAQQDLDRIKSQPLPTELTPVPENIDAKGPRMEYRKLGEVIEMRLGVNTKEARAFQRNMIHPIFAEHRPAAGEYVRQPYRDVKPLWAVHDESDLSGMNESAIIHSFEPKENIMSTMDNMFVESLKKDLNWETEERPKGAEVRVLVPFYFDAGVNDQSIAEQVDAWKEEALRRLHDISENVVLVKILVTRETPDAVNIILVGVIPEKTEDTQTIKKAKEPLEYGHKVAIPEQPSEYFAKKSLEETLYPQLYDKMELLKTMKENEEKMKKTLKLRDFTEVGEKRKQEEAMKNYATKDAQDTVEIFESSREEKERGGKTSFVSQVSEIDLEKELVEETLDIATDLGYMNLADSMAKNFVQAIDKFKDSYPLAIVMEAGLEQIGDGSVRIVISGLTPKGGLNDAPIEIVHKWNDLLESQHIGHSTMKSNLEYMPELEEIIKAEGYGGEEK